MTTVEVPFPTRPLRQTPHLAPATVASQKCLINRVPFVALGQAARTRLSWSSRSTSGGEQTMATVVDERALDERLAQLEAARSWSPRVVSRLEALIRDGDDAALFRVNPFALAAERGLDPAEATDLMLHARPGPVRDGLAADLPALRLRGRELRQAARGDAPVPLPAMPQRVRGRDGRLHRDLLQRLAADPHHPLPAAGDARPVRLHLPLPRRARGPPPERRALHRLHPRGAARDRVRGAEGVGQLRVRRRARRGRRGQRRHRGRLRAADRGRSPSTETAAGPPDLSRQAATSRRSCRWHPGRSSSRSRTRPRSGSPWRSCSSRRTPTTSS